MKKTDVLKEDLLYLCYSEKIEWDRFAGKTIFVTGATGLIGSLLCKAFLVADRERGLGITLIALIRNREKAKTVFGVDFEKLKLVISDIVTLDIDVTLDCEIDYVFHCASITASKTMVNMPVETLMTSVKGTRNLLEFIRKKQVEAFVYVSSMEVYGLFTHLGRDVTEEDMGYINPLSVRSNYPESKRLCENMCVAYHHEYGVHVRVARLAQTFGAGVLPGENRVFAQFAKSVINGDNIVLHTQGKSEGNYCYTADAIGGLLIIALKGMDGEAYNVSNPQTHTTIANMAKLVANEFGRGKCQVVFDIPKTNEFGYAADTKMRLSSDKLKRLGWKPEVGLIEAYRRLIDYIVQNEEGRYKEESIASNHKLF